MNKQWIIGAMAALALSACATTGGSSVPVYGNHNQQRANAQPAGESAVEVASANDPEGEHVQPGDRLR